MHEMMGTKFRAQMLEDGAGEVLIYGEITEFPWERANGTMVGVSAKDLDAELKKIADATKLIVRINSPGGQIFEATAMHTMLETHKATQKDTYIEGICASAANLLPVGTIHMTRGAYIMIHNASAFGAGTAKTHRRIADQLDKFSQQAAQLFARRTGQEQQIIQTWMDEERWLTADEALEDGFIDEIMDDGAGKAVACADLRALCALAPYSTNMPEALKAALRAADGQTPRNEESSNAGSARTEKPNEEGDTEMEFKDITMEVLEANRPELVKQLCDEGMTRERARIREIDDATPPGYEAMAVKAKENGDTPEAFFKAVVAKMKSAGAAFMKARGEETDPEGEVPGASSEENPNTPGDAKKPTDKQRNEAAKGIADAAPTGRMV